MSKKNNIILIADAGSTKTDWAIVEGGKFLFTQTKGINPYFDNTETTAEKIAANPVISKQKDHVDKISFYGAGCSDEKRNKEISNYLKDIFIKASIDVHSDILGASRALFQNKQGIVCILGTGSNCCRYNGKEITRCSPSLGYLAGDEGSGNYMGKELLRSYFYGKLNSDLAQKLENEHQMKKNVVLHSLYKENFPNLYLAGFTPFIHNNKNHQDIKNIINRSFDEFFTNHLVRIATESYDKIKFTGSVAWYFQEELKNMCDKYSLNFHGVIRAPVKELVQFHQKEFESDK